MQEKLRALTVRNACPVIPLLAGFFGVSQAGFISPKQEMFMVAVRDVSEERSAWTLAFARANAPRTRRAPPQERDDAGPGRRP